LININLSTIKREVAEDRSTTEAFRSSLDESLALVQRGVQQAAGVIKNLRQLGSLLRKDSTITDLNAIVDTAVSLMAVRTQRGGVTIHREYGILPKTWCNPQSLSQVLVNVLQNACDEARANGNIWVTTSSDGTSIAIKIRDDGAGVPKDVLPRVFEPYFSTKEGSSGIGLTISRRIVEEHGGTMQLLGGESDTTMVIVLPVRSS
jgi:signal transduction histidine kinase